MCSKISEYFTCGGDPYPGGWACVHSEIRVCTRARVGVWALRRVTCTDNQIRVQWQPIPGTPEH